MMKKKLAATASSKKVKVEIPPSKAAMKKSAPEVKKKKKAKGDSPTKRTTRSAATKTSIPEPAPTASKKGKKLHRPGKSSAAPASAPPFTSNRKQRLRPKFGKTVLTGSKPKPSAPPPVVEISEEEYPDSSHFSPSFDSTPFSSPKVKRDKQKSVSSLPSFDSSSSHSAEPSSSSSAPPSPKMKDRKNKGPAKPASISSLLLNANARSYFNMVEEIPILNIFFANMKIDFENRTLETSVQGKSITITSDDLTSFFGFSTSTDLITVTDLQVESSSFSDIESTLDFDPSFNPSSGSDLDTVGIIFHELGGCRNILRKLPSHRSLHYGNIICYYLSSNYGIDLSSARYYSLSIDSLKLRQPKPSYSSQPSSSRSDPASMFTPRFA
ncbi:hypothetical protein AXF42_Ash015974 [Apostasia shenzhenica]|uniref:Uncharacterized protein n=1 Tax=Apostasia shenzhenica TaxID=1088818 RepID=A0A2I0AWM2_9ASPA|nr:hypothetical protein AXF42_Ash015974 [Apostasia shenzhenica]